MVLRNRVRTFLLALAGCAGCAGSLVLPTDAHAGSAKACGCTPSCAVFQSPFFGLYPTCWRRWPGGQPVCPPNRAPEGEPSRMPPADAESTEAMPAAGGAMKPEEMVPTPKPNK